MQHYFKYLQSICTIFNPPIGKFDLTLQRIKNNDH